MLLTRVLRPATTTTTSISISLTTATTTTTNTRRLISTTPTPLKMYKDKEGNKHSEGNEPHQYQSSNRTDRPEDQWKFRAPYKIHDNSGGDNFDVKWKGKCHCGAIQYELSREKPLASKYCHCTTCQRMHGAPFQWAAIFHKTDINFTNGHHDLGWYDPTAKSTTHHLPCKVQCAYCRTPIMDEGRNMILLFPTLIEGINTERGKRAFEVQSHMFYPQRVVDIKDGKPKWKGLAEESNLVDEETGEELVGTNPKEKKEEEEKEGEGEEKGDKGKGEGKGEEKGKGEGKGKEE